MPETKLESLLVADCGSINTKVGLIDLAAGEYRFVAVGAAATTAEPPVADIVEGVRRAVRQIETRTNRRLLSEAAQLIIPERASGQGVDAFAAATSAATPLRVALVGLSRNVSLAGALHAINGTYATVEATLALDEIAGRSQGQSETAGPAGASQTTTNRPPDPAVMAAERLARANPEVIVLAGGIDGGATAALGELANLIAAIAAAREENTRPTVIFAGNRDARSQIVSRLGQVAALRMVDNIHPTLNSNNPRPLQRELETLYVERKVALLPGFSRFSAWTPVPVVPSARAFEHAIRFLSRRNDLSVVGADIGGTCTTIVTARGDTFTRVVRSGLGTGYGLANVVAQAGLERLSGWLPPGPCADNLLERYLNHSLRPATIPATREEAYCLQAVMREALSTAANQAQVTCQPADLVLLAGSAMSRSSSWGSLALIALDALQPQGVMTLAVDALGLASAFGALAGVDATVAASVIERDGFVTLGTVLVPESGNRDGQVDLRVDLKPEGGGTITLDVEHGSLEVVPLAPGQKASLEVHTVGDAVLGPASHGVYKAEIEGGMLGLIIDARGRPITFPADPAERRTKVQKWFWDVGA